MKRPTVRSNSLKPFFKKNPLIARVAAGLALLISPILFTLHCWLVYFDDYVVGVKDAFGIMIGKWED